MNQEILSLRRNAGELNQVLWEGRVSRYGEPWIALPREVVLNEGELEAVIFELVRPEGLVRPGFLKSWVQAIRPENLGIIAMPAFCVVIAGLYQRWPVDWGVGFLACLGVLLFQASVYALNDVEDHLRLLDLPGTPSGSGVIQKGWISARQLQFFGRVALGLGILVGIPAVAMSPKLLLAVGGLGFLGVLTYSNRPFGMKYKALGDSAFFVVTGPLLAIGIAEAFFQKWDAGIASMGLSLGFAAWAILHAGNLRDMEWDSARKVRTLAAVFGFKASRHFLLFLALLSFGVIFGAVGLGFLPWTVAVSVALALPWTGNWLRKVYMASGPASARLSSIRKEAAHIHLLLGGLIAVGFLSAFLLF